LEAKTTAIFSQSARLVTISGTPTLFLWEPSPGDAGTIRVPPWRDEGRMAGRGDIPQGGQRN